MGVGYNAAADALAAGFLFYKQAAQAHGAGGAQVQGKVAHRLGAQIDEKIVDDAAVDLVIRQDITLVLFRQGAGYFGVSLV